MHGVVVAGSHSFRQGIVILIFAVDSIEFFVKSVLVKVPRILEYGSLICA